MAATEFALPDKVEISAEIDKAFEGLRGIDASLRTLTGRNNDPIDRDRMGGMVAGGRAMATGGVFSRMGGGVRAFPSARDDVGGAVGGRRRFSYGTVGDVEDDLQPDYKRRRVTAGADEFYPEPKFPRPSLASSVAMAPIETKSRDVAINELKSGEKKEQANRNRRMFANLVGTLQRFRRDETQKVNTKEQERKQKEVEERLETSKREDSAKLRQEKAELLAQRRRQQDEIQRLQRKRNLTHIAEREEAHMRLLQGYVLSQAKPPIYYLPAKHTLRSLELLKNSEKKQEELIAARREKLQRDLGVMDTRAADAAAGGGDGGRAPAGRSRPAGDGDGEGRRGRHGRRASEPSDEEEDEEDEAAALDLPDDDDAADLDADKPAAADDDDDDAPAAQPNGETTEAGAAEEDGSAEAAAPAAEHAEAETVEPPPAGEGQGEEAPEAGAQSDEVAAEAPPQMETDSAAPAEQPPESAVDAPE